MGEIKLPGFVCERCEHTWVGRNGGKPVVCPSCKSPYWDTPRKVGKEKKEKEDYGLFPNERKEVNKWKDKG